MDKSIVVTLDHYVKFKKINLDIYEELKIYGEIYKLVISSWIVDRTETVQGPFRTKVLDEHKLRYFHPRDVSLEESLYGRANSIIKQNQKIYIAWSGGIDSTLCLVSLIKSGISKDQLVVCLNNDGIRENPDFYKNHILPNFELISSERMMQLLKFQKLDGIFINGDPADALVGIDFAIPMFKKFGFEFLSLPCTRDNVGRFFLSAGMTQESSDCWFDYFMCSADKSPRTIETMYDFSWWCTFNHRWQTANEKMRTKYEKDISYVRFFDDENLINWSCSHQPSRIDRFSGFKKEYKKLIYDFDKNQKYYEEKVKLESVSINVLANNFAAVLDDSSRLSFEKLDLLDFYEVNNFFKDWKSIN
jgi:hypothetical protein